MDIEDDDTRFGEQATSVADVYPQKFEGAVRTMMTLAGRSTCGLSAVLELPVTATVAAAKTAAATAFGCRVQTLVSEGSVLDCPCKTLADAGVGPSSTVVVILENKNKNKNKSKSKSKSKEKPRSTVGAATRRPRSAVDASRRASDTGSAASFAGKAACNDGGGAGTLIPAPVSDYELQRLANIRRNEGKLASLGLSGGGMLCTSKPKRKRTNQSKRPPSLPLSRRTSPRLAGEAGREPSHQTRSTESVVGFKGAATKPHKAAMRKRQRDAETAAAAVFSPVTSPAESPLPVQVTREATADANANANANADNSVLPLRVGEWQQRDFAWRILAVIRMIPPGKVVAYGQVAALAGGAGKARLVGRLLAEGICSGFDAPWQRVINAGGRISLMPSSGGARQRELLEAEGVTFKPTGKVDTAAWWDPDPATLTLFR